MKKWTHKMAKFFLAFALVLSMTLSLGNTANAEWTVDEEFNQTYYYDDTTGEQVLGWKTIGDGRYYFDPNNNGAMVTGWFQYKDKWFYCNEEGKKQKGLLTIDGQKYYVDGSTGRFTGWKTINNIRYYFNPDNDGAAATSWFLYNGKWFYCNADGKKCTGLITVDGRKYYVDGSTGRFTGWKTVNNVRYYFNPEENGAAAVGWLKYKEKLFYFDANGAKKTGWLTLSDGKYYVSSSDGAYKGWKTISEKRYYFDTETGRMQTGWFDYANNGRRYYLGTDGVKVTGWKTIDGKRYYFDSYGRMTTGWIDYKGKKFYMGTDGVKQVGRIIVDGVEYYVDSAKGKLTLTSKSSTIKELLQTALLPVGKTMYIWGGGWNSADNGAGKTAVTLGVSPTWEAFYQKQTSSYNYRNYRYQSEKGLDCSGYIGWLLYNVFETTNGKPGYVMLSGKMPQNYANRGWGTYTAKASVKDWKAGDILGNDDHVFLVVGQCTDGSFVLLHSSPPGVRIAGTPDKNGNTNSKAAALAKRYMEKYYPDWCKKYPKYTTSATYRTAYNRMRWDVNKDFVMYDPDGYQNMTAEQVLKDMFGE